MKKIGLKFIVLFYSLIINTLSFINEKWASQFALSLFKKPRGGKPDKKTKTFLEENLVAYLQVNASKIAYYRWPGNGPKILLAHGWESHSARWKSYLNDLQAIGFDIYALDAPAHGLSGGNSFTPISYADAIEAMIRKFDIPILIGHSVGAYASLICAHREQNQIYLQHILLLAPTGKIKEFMERFFNALHLRQAIRNSYYKEFYQSYNQDISYYDSDHLIKFVKNPGLLIHDTEDKILPYHHSEMIAQNWEKGKFISTTGYGHRLKSSEIKQHLINYLKANILSNTKL